MFRDVPSPGATKPTLLYKLDKKEGVPLEVDYFLGDAYAKGEPYHIWRATKLDTRQGRLVAVESEDLDIGARNPSQIAIVGKVTVRSITFDKDYPKSRFWPTLQPGVNVMDGLARKTSRQPGVRAQAKSKGLIPPAWGVILGLGFAILVAGFGLGLRRRRRVGSG